MSGRRRPSRRRGGSAEVNIAASAEDRSFTLRPAAADLAAVRRRGVRPLHGQRDHRRRRVRLGAGRRRRTAGQRHVLPNLVPPARRLAVRPDLRRCAEEHRSGRADDRDRARGPGRPRATRHAVDARLRDPREGGVDVQHPADVRDLHRRPGVPPAARDRRRRGSRAAEQGQGRPAVRLPRRLRLLHQPGRAGRPVADERAVHAGRPGAGRGVPGRGRQARTWCS